MHVVRNYHGTITAQNCNHEKGSIRFHARARVCIIITVSQRRRSVTERLTRVESRLNFCFFFLFPFVKKITPRTDRATLEYGIYVPCARATSMCPWQLCIYSFVVR